MDSLAPLFDLIVSVAALGLKWVWALPLPVLAVLAGLFLAILLRPLFRRRAKGDAPAPRPRSRRVRPLPAIERLNWIVIDGSNVMYWGQEEPNLDPVLAVLRDVGSRGFVPILWFDANAGYLIENRYADEIHLARKLGVAPEYVFVAPKGTPADPLILYTARELSVPIITNDRYRDWSSLYPEVLETGRLIRGRIDSGYAILTMPSAAILAEFKRRAG